MLSCLQSQTRSPGQSHAFRLQRWTQANYILGFMLLRSLFVTHQNDCWMIRAEKKYLLCIPLIILIKVKKQDTHRETQHVGWTEYSPLTGAALQPQLIGHNSTWRWESPVSVAPLSWVHLHQSEKQMGKKKGSKKKKKARTDEQTRRCLGNTLTNSLVWRVSPLARVTWTQGMDSWWGMGHVYFTTLDLYLTCTLSDRQGKKNKVINLCSVFIS